MVDQTDLSEEALAEYQRYLNALHAMQTGVAFTMNDDPHQTEPKHLRVGVNAAMVHDTALVKLLVAAGIFTTEQYMTAIADEMEIERDLYAARIGPSITLH